MRDSVGFLFCCFIIHSGYLFKMFFSLTQVHGSVGEPWWLWVEDPINDHIYHSEYFLLQKKQVIFFLFYPGQYDDFSQYDVPQRPCGY